MIGHLAGKRQADPIVAGRQLVTREWWKGASARYELCISELVLEECRAGDPAASQERLLFLETLSLLAGSGRAALLTQELINRRAIPETEPRDASHISIAATNGIQYLVTWNFRHIANVVNRNRIEEVCRDMGFEPPKICTPDELLGV